MAILPVNEHFTNIRSLLDGLAKAMNLINQDVENHHEQTAYLAYLIAQELGLEREDVHLCIYAGLLHDIGAIVTELPQSVLEIERDARRISELGAEMLQDLPMFEEIAGVIRYCQCRWSEVEACLDQATERERVLAVCAGIIFLADKVSAFLDPKTSVLTHGRKVRKMVEMDRGKWFCPEAVDAFLRLSELEFVWLDIRYNPQFMLLFTGDIHQLSLETTVELTRLMSRIIDFRSPFTAMHSAGVAASAKALAELAGMSREECLMMEIAGNLHDVGKLRVPRAILEKPGRLEEEEFDVIKEHPYFTRFVLMNIDGFEKIRDWASLHHEKLNGTGYPFHFGAEQLDTGARIMAIADIFSAITEDRPYRAGMSREESIAILRGHVERGELDADLVELLCAHYEEIDQIRDEASHRLGKKYYDSLSDGIV